jgi:hypothetical protein
MSIQKEMLKDYFMESCHIKDKNNLLFTAAGPQEIPDPFEGRPYRIIQYYGDKPTDMDSWSIIRESFINRMFAGWVTEPEPCWLVVSYWGHVLRMPEKIEKDSSDNIREQNIPPYPGAEVRMVRKAKALHGKMYMVASGREVRRRDAPDTWTILSNGVPDKFAEKDGSKMGFSDIDGFSENDLYAGGRNGDVWHWDGQIWKKVTIPTNANIYGVCCGGDGLVYLSTGVETIVVGRGNRWKIISYAQEKYLGDVKFRNMVWFKDRIYMGYGSTLYEIKEGKFQKSKLNDMDGRPVDWSFIDVTEELMLAGSKLEVALFDGERFETVIPFEIGG